MAARDERVAWVVPGRSQAATGTSAPSRQSDRLWSMAKRRPVLRTIAIACVLIMLISSLPPVGNGNARGGLRLDTSSSGSNNSTYYPYLASPSLYPQPDALYSPQCPAPPTCNFQFTDPQTVAAVVTQVPTFLLLGVSVATNGSSQAYFLRGTYNATLAQQILAGSSAAHLPIQWSSAVPVGAAEPRISGASLAAAADGSAIFAAFSWSGSTVVYRSLAPSYGNSWTDLTPTPISGSHARLSFGGSAAVLVTNTTSSVTATTFYLSGTPSSASASWSGAILDDAVTWLPSSGLGTEAIVTSVPSSALYLSTSQDGGHTFSQAQIGKFTPSNNTTAFNSVGSTAIFNPGGNPGQVAIASQGTTVLVVYTTNLQGTVVAAVISSFNEGSKWVGPYDTALSLGAIAEPAVSSSASGNFYLTWRENSQGTWSVDAAVYSGDGRPLQSPVILPSSAGAKNLSSAYPAIAIDPFQRPFFAWPGRPGTSVTIIRYTGGFLSPSNALAFLESQIGSPTGGLTSWDFRNGASTGTNGSLYSILDNRISWATQNLSNYVSHQGQHGDASYLCNAQNVSANRVYPNATHIQFQYSSGATVCGNLSPAVADTNSSTSSGAPKNPKNFYWSPSVGMTLGPNAANTFLAVITDWALEGEGIPVTWAADPLRAFNPTASVLPDPVALFTNQRSTTLGNSHWSHTETLTVTINATALNPTTGLLVTSDSGPSNYTTSYQYGSCTILIGGHQYPGNVGYNVTVTPSSFTSAVSAAGNTSRQATATSALPSFYLTNLTANATVGWQGTFTVGFTVKIVQYGVPGELCSGTYPSYSNSSLSVPLTGTDTTTLRARPWTPYLVNPKSVSYVFENWTNSMNAQAWFNLSDLSTGARVASLNNPLYAGSETFKSPSLTATQWYLAKSAGLSRNGFVNRSLTPSASAGQMTSAQPLWMGWSCTFQYTSNPIKDWGFRASNYTDGNLTLQWYSNQSGAGWARYSEFGVGINLTQTAQVVAAGSNWEYLVQLHGLAAGSFFNLTGTTAVASGCLQWQSSNSTVFATLTNFALTEHDYPYDSISHTGGGAALYWNLPSNITNYANLASGFASYTNLSNSSRPTVVLPLSSPLNQLGGTYLVNLTGLGQNSNFSAQVILNYSLKSNPTTTFQFISRPCDFVYLLDTSGDGLTDVEKLNGWWVPVPNAPGTAWNYFSTTSWVTAKPSVWATNGLVSDFVEKQFDIDPNTVDTAGSHMLDTWNMTYQLSNSTCPAGLECWYENSSNPFSFSVTPGGSPPPNNAPVATNSTSVAHWTKAGLQDDSPYDAEVLWTGGAVGVLQGLIASENVGWLRGVIMKYNGQWTLTVWGKLSWGANPLAQSTVGDGLPDGQQPNPLLREVIQINVTSWSASLQSSNDEAAPFLDISSEHAGTGQTWYDGYGPSQKGSQVSSNGSYEVSVPIVSQSQFVFFNVSVDDNGSATGRDWYHPVVYSSPAIDLLGQHSVIWYNQTASNGSLHLTYGILRVGQAANTLLWAPSNNSTLSSLPWGLKRYTAEPDFDLIVLDLTAATTVTNVAGAEGGWKYSISLSAGLNNLLIPRGEFLGSPLGQAMINNTNESYTIPSGAGVTFHATDWSGRTETSGSNSIPTASNPNANYIWVYSSLNQYQNGSTSGIYGGVPSNPAVEAGGESLQVQAVYWVNVSATGYGGLSSSNAELADLFGGLVLNASGNPTGNIVGVTSELVSLGLSSNVRAALANVSLPNGGAYSAPKYHQPPPSPPWWQLAGSVVWNTLSGIAEISGLATLVSVVWGALQAAAAYVDEAAAWLSTHLGLGKLSSQFASGLKKLASAMLWAMETLATTILNLVQVAFSGVVYVLNLAFQNYVTGVKLGLQNFFTNISRSPISLTPTLQSMAALLLALMGLSGLVQTLNQIFGEVMSVVQPVLSFIGFNRLIQVLTGAIESGLGSGTVARVQGAISWFNSLAYSLLSNSLSGLFNALGLSTKSLSFTGTAPTGSGINSFVTSVANSSNTPTVNTDMGSATSGWSSSLDVLDAVHLGIVAGVLLMLFLTGLKLVSPGLPPGFNSPTEWLAAGNPPTQSLAGIGKLVEDLLIETVGLVVDIFGAILSSCPFEAVTLSAFGEFLALYSTVDVGVHSVQIFENSAGAIPYVLGTMAVGDALGGLVVIGEAEQA